MLKPALARGLEQLKAFEGDVEATYCRSFVVDITDMFGSHQEIELRPGGSKIPVTNANRDGQQARSVENALLTYATSEYVKLLTQYILVRSVDAQFRPLIAGFMNGSWWLPRCLRQPS